LGEHLTRAGAYRLEEMLQEVDLVEREQNLESAICYLGRYMHVQPSELEEISTRRFAVWLQETGKIVRAENGDKNTG
jgi:hypothetical protein